MSQSAGPRLPSPLEDLEARQEDVIRRLDELNERIEAALAVSRPLTDEDDRP